ncbi:hypothetical protein L208DRAFT_1283570, partial [Tricholoma matsutake]
CFVCQEDEATGCPGNIRYETLDCSTCGPRVQVNQSNGQRILEHMGMHILFNSTIDNPNSEELCGLYLHPSPICRLNLKKGCGTTAGYNIDINSSTCISLVRFNCTTAACSSDAPCSNVPIICPLCPAKSPVVWTYNLCTHIQE